jgi:hypothetical protein
MDEAYSDDAAHIATSLSQANYIVQLPPVNDQTPSDPFNIYDPSLIDLSEFVQLRFSHQTKQAATGIRTTTQAPALEGPTKLTERQRVLQRFSKILKQQEEKGIGTGLERAARWARVNVSTVTSDVGVSGSGNSANAAAVAKAVATKVRETLHIA